MTASRHSNSLRCSVSIGLMSASSAVDAPTIAAGAAAALADPCALLSHVLTIAPAAPRGKSLPHAQEYPPPLAHQPHRLRQLREHLVAELGVAVEERHPCDLVGAVFPRVIRPPLDHDIA